MTLETFIEWQNAFLENKPKVLLTEAVKIAENDKKKIKPTGRQLWQSGGLKSVDFVEKDGKNADFGEKAPEEKQNAAVKVGDEALFLDESLLEDLERFELE